MSPLARHAGLQRRPLRSALGLALPVLLALATAVAGAWFWATTSAPTAAVSPGPSPTVSARPGEPTRVRIPAIGVDARLVPVGLQRDGAMQTPDFGLAAWYRLGPRPGEPGPAVVLAHVDSKAGPDVFFRLAQLQAGDRVVVQHRGGAVRFVVQSKEQVRKEQLPTERIWNDTDKPVLRLITCGGEFDRSAGSYRDNIIVYASLEDPAA